jgi:hypothetical protein
MTEFILPCHVQQIGARSSAGPKHLRKHVAIIYTATILDIISNASYWSEHLRSHGATKPLTGKAQRAITDKLLQAMPGGHWSLPFARF